MATEQQVEKVDDKAGKKSGLSTLKIVIISVSLAFVLGGALVGATFYFVSNMNAGINDGSDSFSEQEIDEDIDESEPVKPPQYYSMEPKFIVSFSNQKSARFMQFSLEIMTRDSDVIKQIEAHMPVIRSNLLMLIGSQTYEVMVTREGKEKLLNDITNDINASLQKITGETEPESTVEAAYFSAFVIQ